MFHAEDDGGESHGTNLGECECRVVGARTATLTGGIGGPRIWEGLVVPSTLCHEDSITG